jgi:long-chain acyl-CoA synthetase
MDGYDGRIEVDGCDTIPKLFWHQVKARDGRTAFREKTLGIWQAASMASAPAPSAWGWPSSG